MAFGAPDTRVSDRKQEISEDQARGGPRFSLVPARSDSPERMDQPGLDPEEVREAHRVLRIVNRQFFGGLWVLRRELRRWIDQVQPPRDLCVLDLGSGSGDLLLEARKYLLALNFKASVLGVDRDPIPLAMARESGVTSVKANALNLPFPDRSSDLVCAIKFAHHFSGAELDQLICEMARVAKSRVLILDIRRNWLAYAGFVCWSWLFTKNALVRFDGPLSVRRGFLPEELLRVAHRVSGYQWTVRRYAGFQIVLVGERETMQRIKP